MGYEFTGRRVGFAPPPGFGAVSYGSGGYVPGPEGYGALGAVRYGRGGIVASQWPRASLSGVRYGSGGVVPGQWGRMGSLATGSLGSLGEDEDEGEDDSDTSSGEGQPQYDESGNIIGFIPYAAPVVIGGGLAAGAAAAAAKAKEIWDAAAKQGGWWGGSDQQQPAPMPQVEAPGVTPLPPGFVDPLGPGQPCNVTGGRGYRLSSGLCEADTCDAGYVAATGPSGNSICAPASKAEEKKKAPGGGGGGSAGGAMGPRRPAGAVPPAGGPAAAPGKAKKSLLKNPLVWVGAVVALGGVGLVAYKARKR